MIWNAETMHRMKTGESVLVTHKPNGKPLRGQGDITYLFSRCPWCKFATRTLTLVDSVSVSAVRCIMVTCLERGQPPEDRRKYNNGRPRKNLTHRPSNVA